MSVSLAVCSPHYPKARIKGDREMIEALVEVHTLRRFVGIMHRFASVDLVIDWIQDETTILRFRHLRSEKPGRTADFRITMRPGQRRALTDTPEGRLEVSP